MKGVYRLEAVRRNAAPGQPRALTHTPLLNVTRGLNLEIARTRIVTRGEHRIHGAGGTVEAEKREDPFSGRLRIGDKVLVPHSNALVRVGRFELEDCLGRVRPGGDHRVDRV